MKKSISMLLAAMMLTGALSGCGGSSSSASSDSQASGNGSGGWFRYARRVHRTDRR